MLINRKFVIHLSVIMVPAERECNGCPMACLHLHNVEPLYRCPVQEYCLNLPRSNIALFIAIT